MKLTLPNVGNSHWLTPWEKERAISVMLRYGLIKWSNKGDLPLKSGDTTDIYINLRDARNHPEAIQWIASFFSSTLTRLGVDRLAEIPHAVTCFSGVIAGMAQLPLVTIRDQPKAGRVSDANIIGEIKPAEYIGLFDDVITDGESKLQGYQQIITRGANPILVVLVDREQGWRQTFRSNDVKMPVWAGMSLHDVRAFLIKQGLMERCSKQREDANGIILALDGRPWDELLPILEKLRPTGTILKTNDILAHEGMRQLLPSLSVYGRVMVDLKFHDIPNTVSSYCKHLAEHDVWACTVHASGGPEMIRASAHALKETSTKVLAVTVLTSIDKETGEEIFQRSPISQVKVLAKLAWQAGANGFVCSPHEAGYLREEYPEALIVTPGVRSKGVSSHDQQRVSTPAAAFAAGANYIVGGREFLQAPDPVAEIERVLSEVAITRLVFRD